MGYRGGSRANARDRLTPRALERRRERGDDFICGGGRGRGVWNALCRLW